MRAAQAITANPFGLDGFAWRETRYGEAGGMAAAGMEAAVIETAGAERIGAEAALADGEGPLVLRLPADLAGAVPRRRAEFLAGRLCAMLALRAIGAPPEVGRAGRAPVWPAGATGSIAHAGGRAIAVAARRPARLGVDCETLLTPRTAAEIGPLILAEPEWRLRPEAMEEARFLTLAFSAKEALYKALSDSLDEIPDFHAARVTGVGPGRIRLAGFGREAEIAYAMDVEGCATLCRL